MTHTIESAGIMGGVALTHFTLTVRNDEYGVDCVHVHEQKVAVDGVVSWDKFYPLDTVAGRDRLGRQCVAPDMIPLGSRPTGVGLKRTS